MSCHIHLHLLLSGYAQIVIHVSKFFSLQVLLSHSWPNGLWSICREHLLTRVFNFGLKLRKTNCFFYFCMGMEETNFVYSTCTFMIPGADVLVQEHGLVGHSAKMVILVTREKFHYSFKNCHWYLWLYSVQFDI